MTRHLKVFVLLNVLDAFTTALGLWIGFAELNGFAASLGPGMFGLKACATVGFVYIVLRWGHMIRPLKQLVIVMCGFLYLVVLSNALQIIFA